MKDQQLPKRSKHQDITAADVKGCKGYENISDEAAQEIAAVIRVYTEIIYNSFRKGNFEEQKAKVISISKRENKKAA